MKIMNIDWKTKFIRKQKQFVDLRELYNKLHVEYNDVVKNEKELKEKIHILTEKDDDNKTTDE